MGRCPDGTPPPHDASLRIGMRGDRLDFAAAGEELLNRLNMPANRGFRSCRHSIGALIREKIRPPEEWTWLF